MATTMTDRYREWIAQNPLRLWREQENVAIYAAASMLGLGVSTIQSWESGVYKPRDEHLDMLARLIDDPDLPDRWHRWYEQKPTV